MRTEPRIGVLFSVDIRGGGGRLLAALLAALFFALPQAWAATVREETGPSAPLGNAPAPEEPSKTAPSAGFEDILGIKILSVRLSAKGSIVDFRYKLVDPQKARPLFDRKVNPYLLDSASGTRLVVPTAPKVGALRTTKNPVAGRHYFLLFGNPGGIVKKGSKVSVVVGDLKSEELVVE